MITSGPKIVLPELLAPAGDWDALRAAVAAGADAVYLGGKSFGARQYASNFDDRQLREAIEFLHIHGKKIYVTVNTLINNTEIGEALNFLVTLYNAGVDAVIVQDLGLIHLARRYLPSLALHASTQMTVHNLAGAVFLKDWGFKRAILARELTEAEVTAIVRQSGIGIEIFIHGALCICYSGQCLLSSMIGGRSGNRGRCAQPCRMEYQLMNSGKPVPAEGPYLLSPKDLALITKIPELVRSGVVSLKIEGRMKRPEYVYSVVKTYRAALDRYARQPEQFQVYPEELQELEQAFNRGFTTGYFDGNRNYPIMSYLRPNNRGIYLGRILKADYSRSRAVIKLEAGLEHGDEIEVWVSKGGRVTAAITNLEHDGRMLTSAGPGMTVSFALNGKVFPGDRVFKVFSMKSNQEAKQAIANGNPGLRIPCGVLVQGELGGKLKVTYTDSQGNQGTAISDIPLQPARNRPLTGEVLAEQLGRLGDTPYHLEKLHSELADDLMLPVSELNQIRRRAIAALKSSALACMQTHDGYHRKAIPPMKDPLFVCKNRIDTGDRPEERTLLSVWVNDLPGVIAAAENGADLIYAGGDELLSTGDPDFHWNQNNINEAIYQAHQSGARLIINLPRIQREIQPAFRGGFEELKSLLTLEPDGIMISNVGALQIILQESELPIYLNYSINIFNDCGIQGVKERVGSRLEQITLSPELTLEQIQGLYFRKAGLRLECLVQGPLELMIAEYCPVGSVISRDSSRHLQCSGECASEKGSYCLRDRLNLDFPVVTDRNCRMHLFNSKDLCLYEDLPDLVKSGPLVLRLELKIHTAMEVGYICKIYKTALAKMEQGLWNRADSGAIVDELMKYTGRGITKGHYFRGVE
jgi:putative protease